MNEYEEFCKTLEKAHALIDKIDIGDELHIRIMELRAIDLLTHIAENITYSEWSDKDEVARQDDLIAEINGYKHILCVPAINLQRKKSADAD